MHKLEVVSKMLFKKLYVYKDSMLIIFQVNGEWQTKNEKLRPYQENLTKLIKDFDKIKFTYLNRDKNQFPDALTTLASMAKINCGIKV
jgi:ribonuclease HI